jgi:polysaccharide biosynthesis protein PslH
MKILIVTPLLPYPEAINAGPLVMFHHVTAIAARHQVILASLAGPDPAEREAVGRLRASGLDVRAVWRSQAGVANGALSSRVTQLTRRLRRAGSWLRGEYPFRSLHFWEPQMQQLLAALFTERTFDVLDVHDNQAAMGAYRYSPRIPTVLTEHEVRDLSEDPNAHLPRAGWVEARIRELDRRRSRRFQTAVWRRFDRIQVFTSRDANTIRTLTPALADRVRVNPFGVDLPKACDPSGEDANLLVFVGGFRHPPSVDAALWLGTEIMPLLRARRPGLRLAIVGSNPPKDVQALAREDIVVTGWVPSIGTYLERAAVVLAPVRLGGGMRLKVLQAMALGKPVVTTPLGAEGLAMAGQPRSLVIVHEADGIATATLELLAADHHRRALGGRAREFIAQHHTWAAYTERLEAIYSELVDTTA